MRYADYRCLHIVHSQQHERAVMEACHQHRPLSLCCGMGIVITFPAPKDDPHSRSAAAIHRRKKVGVASRIGER